MGNETNNATPMQDCREEPRPAWSRHILTNDDIICELALEHREISQILAKLEKAIESNPKDVREHHKNCVASRLKLCEPTRMSSANASRT